MVLGDLVWAGDCQVLRSEGPVGAVHGSAKPLNVVDQGRVTRGIEQGVRQQVRHLLVRWRQNHEPLVDRRDISVDQSAHACTKI